MSHLNEIILRQPKPPPTRQNFNASLEQKYLLRRYTEIYKYSLSKSLKNAVLGVTKWCSANVFFWHQTETCLLEKRLLALLQGHIISNVK